MKKIRQIKAMFLVLCLICGIIPICGNSQEIYASTLSKKEKNAYMAKLNEIKNKELSECRKAIKSEEWYSEFDLYMGMGYKFYDVDKDSKLEMIVYIGDNSTGAIHMGMGYEIYKLEKGKVVKKAFIGDSSLPAVDLYLTSKYIIEIDRIMADSYVVTVVNRKTYKEEDWSEVGPGAGEYYGVCAKENDQVTVANGKAVEFKLLNLPTLRKGKSYSIYAGDTKKIGKKSAKWLSLNKKIVSIDKNGKMTGKKTGQAYVCKKTKGSETYYKIKVKKKEKLKDGTYYVPGPKTYGKISGNKYIVDQKLQSSNGKTYGSTKRQFTISSECKYGHYEEKFYPCTKKKFIEDYMTMPYMSFMFTIKNGKVVKFAMAS